MEYIEIISLNDAKQYLKVDDCQDQTDNEIIRMIKSSLSFIEKRTGHILKKRTNTYYALEHKEATVVYDYPIDNTVSLLDIRYRPLSAVVPTTNGKVELSVGYDSIDDIPSELIDAALQLIKVWFYESETQTNSTLIPKSVMEAIDVNRRFV